MAPTSNSMHQGLRFVAVSGAGWVLDVAVFMALSGPGGWGVASANVVGGVCGALLVFAVSAVGIFQRNESPMLHKLVLLLPFNLCVIGVSSVVLAGLAHLLATGLAGWDVQPGAVRLAAKVIVTPFTLALNFIVVRWLLERFEGLGALTARPGRAQ